MSPNVPPIIAPILGLAITFSAISPEATTVGCKVASSIIAVTKLIPEAKKTKMTTPQTNIFHPPLKDEYQCLIY